MKKNIILPIFVGIIFIISQGTKLDFVSATDNNQLMSISSKESGIVNSYRKELIIQYDSFDDVKKAGESINYGEHNNSNYYYGSLDFHEAQRIENTDKFKVTYIGELNGSNK